jgi:hypothetical protein
MEKKPITDSAYTSNFAVGNTVMAGDCVQIQSATKMRILFLNLFATAAQRNDLAVLSNSFDRGTAALIR